MKKESKMPSAKKLRKNFKFSTSGYFMSKLASYLLKLDIR